MTTRPRFLSLALLATLVAGGGCTVHGNPLKNDTNGDGVVDERDDDPNDDDDDDTDPVSEGEGEGEPFPEDDVCADVETNVADAMAPRALRLLTRAEYRRSVRDLLQLTETPCAATTDCDVARESCVEGACRADACGTVSFIYDAPGTGAVNDRIHIAGDFNAWTANWDAGVQLAYSASLDAWWGKAALGNGAHAYKIVLDESTWIADPRSALTVSDGFGGVNSVVDVDCASATAGDVGEDFADRIPPDSHPDAFPFESHSASGLVTPVHVDEYLTASERAANAAPDFPACASNSNADACGDTFVRGFGRRAFRRPLIDSEVARYKNLFAAASTFIEGERLVAQAMLSSPAFLYRSELGVANGDVFKLDAFETATALSYFFWGTTPDETLLDAAAAGELDDDVGIEAQARRLLDDPQAQEIMGSFALQWLGAARVLTVDKSPSLFPGFDAAVRADLARETSLFFSRVMFEESGRYDELLTSKKSFVTARTAPIYGASTTSDGPVWMDLPSDRSGILTQGSVLASTSHSNQTSPIRRGLFVRRALLCQEFAPPPPNAGGVPEVDPNATTRERFFQHTNDPFCAACHAYIDPTGFGFEGYDPIGARRSIENGIAIDESGDMNDVEWIGSATSAPFTSMTALADTLVDSDAAKQCFVKQVVRYAEGRDPSEELAQVCALRRMSSTFADGNLKRALHLGGDGAVVRFAERAMKRRSVLQALGGAALTLPFLELLRAQKARAGGAQVARRAIFFYFPDGVSGPSQNGEPSEWHCTGSEHDFSLTSQLSPLSSLKNDCVFINGVSSGGTDSGSHPGGAKKILTAVDGGNGMSVDQYLAGSVFSSSPWRHLYLGAMSTQNGASGDKHISYPAAGQSIAPEDNPRTAFQRLFSSGVQTGGTTTVNPADLRRASILDVVKHDLGDLRNRLGSTEQQKLALHLESVREIEQRIQAMPPPVSASCETPALAYDVDDGALYDPSRFPEIAKAQIDVMVLAMACGITRCGTIQLSHHTSELIMSRFPNTELSDPNFDMRSHQASHYGASHDPGHIEYARFVQQRRWFVSQFAYLLDQLKQREDPAVPGATMLDTSVVLLCSEISDGNTHSHDNLPFIVGGKAGGAFSTGRLLQVGYERHHKLLTSIARACGAQIDGFGQDAGGTLPGL